MKASKIAKPFRITDGERFRLKDFDPADTGGFKSKDDAQETLERGLKRLSELQQTLYAQDRWAILLILQGIDAAGKDGTISHVMSGLNPEGCDVTSFKEPSAEELQHDFMWRCARELPQKGRIAVFNRSYYEEVLVVRVHPEFLANEKLPPSLVSDKIWKERFEDINANELYLSRNGIVILKFFLNLSKKEQKKRFLSRLDEPEKHWKFSADDIRERKYWDKYAQAFEDMVRNTSTKHAPWYVVPADHKWFTRVVVAEALVQTLEDLKLSYPNVDSKTRKELKEARKILEKKK